MVGGGPRLRPGLVTQAHHGTLFLDELAEFDRHVLDALRQPLDDGRLADARLPDEEPYREEITDTFKSTSLGALFGAGAMIPVGRHFVILELRYVQGLNDIVDRDSDEDESFLGSPSIKYKGLELLAGFAFTIGGGS